MRNVFLAYGIQLGCFASVIYVTVANDTIHVDVREVVDNESTFGMQSVPRNHIHFAQSKLLQ